jgi:hypothetical protein
VELRIEREEDGRGEGEHEAQRSKERLGKFERVYTP